jgi:hypothetical protein
MVEGQIPKGKDERMNARRALGILMVLLPLTPAAMGDGGYIPEVAYPANPTIPTQRALITFRDGKETLVVESSFVTDSPNVGWILPLPAKPTRLDRADPGLLLSLSTSLRPSLTHNLYEFFRNLCWLAAFVLACSLIMILAKDSRGPLLLLTAFVSFFAYAILVPTLGKGEGQGSTVVPGITEVQSQRVGNYDVTVLSASGAEAVSTWLTANSLKGLDAKAKGIIDDYAGRKWCFLVARLHKDGNAPATPHPILAKFPSASIVYPMKLTAIADCTTRVELFVAADSQAAAPGFQCVAADRFDVTTNGWRGYMGPYYLSDSTGMVIGNPDARHLLWPGCVVTKLVADVKPDQMAADVAIEPKALVPYRQHVFSPKGRGHVIAVVALGGAILVMLWAAVAFRGRRIPSKKHLEMLGGAAVLVALACAAVYVLLPTVPVYGAGNHRGYYAYSHSYHLVDAAKYLNGKGLLAAKMTDEQLAKFPELVAREEQLAAEHVTNPMTGKPMRFERSPWNFSVRREGNKVYLCFYDEDCLETRVELSEPLPPEK